MMKRSLKNTARKFRLRLKRCVTLLLCVLLTSMVYAQPTLITSTEAIFHNPESAAYDAARRCIYISNLDKATPVEALHTDFISRMLMDGTVTDLRFIDGLSSPTGLAMHGGLLYAVERDGVAVIDPETRRIVQRYPIAGAGFLNDIAIDPVDGTLYVSETDSAGRIYRIREGVAEVWVQDSLLALNNGLLVLGNRLAVGVNRDNFLKSVDLETRAIENFVFLGPGNIDGIQATSQGLLVSHFLGNLYAIDRDRQVQELLNTRAQDIFIADFAYLSFQRLLVVPSLRTNRVYVYEYDAEAAVVDTVLMVAPHPQAARSTGPSWVDSLDAYARDKFLPAKKYNWTWQQSALLRAMTAQYDHKVGPDPAIYLDYVRTAIDKSMDAAWAGHNPNGVASGAGLAWLARITGEAKYRTAAEQLYQKYLQIPRMPNGAVWHLKRFGELWDDTIFMVGTYLLEMYLLTDDEKYLDELLLQVQTHREKLQVTDPNAAGAGLWVHGWDGDDKDHCRLCSQQNWDENAGHRSTQIWGRGNGWVIVTLTQVVESLPKTHPKWPTFAGYLREMLVHLPELQDTATGHWFQLPVYPHAEGNFIESSCTAMFGYGIAGALRLGIVERDAYRRSVERAYAGLRMHSMEPRSGGAWLGTLNVCQGTCIGDQDYYFKRKAKAGTAFGVGMVLLFGRAYRGR